VNTIDLDVLTSHIGAFVFKTLDTWTYAILTDDLMPNIISSPYRKLNPYFSHGTTESIIVNIPITALRKLVIRDDLTSHYNMLLNTNDGTTIQKMYFAMVCLNWIGLRAHDMPVQLNKAKYILEDVLSRITMVVNELIATIAPLHIPHLSINDGCACFKTIETNIFVPLLAYSLNHTCITEYQHPVYQNMLQAYDSLIHEFVLLNHMIIGQYNTTMVHDSDYIKSYCEWTL
jgi:hypothetical protein